jgi:putative ABC transport system permease protein
VIVTMATVALGASALTVALVLGATVQKGVDRGFQVEYENVDVIVHTGAGADVTSASASVGGSTSAIDTKSLNKIEAFPSTGAVGTYTRATAVAQAGDVSRGITLDSLNTNADFQWMGWLEGRPPQSDTEIALSPPTLAALKIGFGDRVALGLPSVGNAVYTVVGVINTRGSMDRQGSAYGIVTKDVAQRLAGITGPNTLEIQAKPGAKIDSLVNDINRKAPIGLPTRTSEILDGNRSVRGTTFNGLSIAIAALAGVSCLVAGITSATTTAASLASRRRSWALARCIGAGKKQIGLLVAAEAVALSLLGSVLGVILGIGLAWAALPLIGLVPSLPALGTSTFTIPVTAILGPVLLAVVLGLLGSIVPAWRATRIPPSAALKATEAGSMEVPRWRLALASLAVLVGAGMGYIGSGHRAWVPVAVGSFLLVCGCVALLKDGLAGVAQVLARRSRSVAPRLGLLDIVRRPNSAAIEAAAVSLAVGMIALSWVALASLQQSASARISESPMPDLTVGSVSGGALSPTTPRAVKAVDGVHDTAFVSFGQDVAIVGKSKGRKVHYATGTATVDVGKASRVLPDGFPVTKLRSDTVYLPTSSFPPFPAGSKVNVVGPKGSLKGLSVQYLKNLQVPSMISPAAMAKVSRHTEVRLGWLKIEPGVDRSKVVDEITAIALRDNQAVGGPVILDIRVANGLAATRAAAAAILGIAVLVAVIGAAATAALAISERAREHAMLRALGLSRRSLGRLLGTRVLFIAIFASVLGVTTGSVLGLIAARLAISLIGLDPKTSLPAIPILLVVACSVLAVRVAALIPMERASYIPPSRAIARG